MKFEELMKKLTQKNENGHEYSLTEIAQIANDILNEVDYYSRRGATPIVKIAKEFGFKTYKESLKDGKSGDIQIDDIKSKKTLEKYGHDKIILVNKTDERYHQRFVVAHELAHYLFDFLGKPESGDSDVVFTDTYQKNKHDTLREKRANAFAAEIMMPKDLFVKQYNIAKRENNNRIFIMMYLSRFFETSIESIEKRLLEVSI